MRFIGIIRTPGAWDPAFWDVFNIDAHALNDALTVAEAKAYRVGPHADVKVIEVGENEALKKGRRLTLIERLTGRVH